MHDRIQPRSLTGAAPAPLAYVRPGVLPPRPAILTAVAIVGIVYAVIGFAVNVLSFTFHAGLWWLEPAPVKVVPPPPIPAVSVEPYDGDPSGADGLKRAQRDAVVARVRERIKLPDDRAAMLRRLLADVGQRMFPRDVDVLDPGATLVVESGRVPGPDGSDPRASHSFVTRRGRVELSDYTATFMLDGATTPVRLVRNVLHDGDAPPRWSSVAIAEALAALHERVRSTLTVVDSALAHGTLTAEQASVLSHELRERGATKPSSWHVRPSVTITSLAADGALLYVASGGRQTWLLPDGRSIDHAAAPHGVNVVTGIPHVRVAPHTARYWPGSRGAFALLAVDGLLSAILAAYLFVGAVLLLREQPHAGERHVRFIMIKVPLLLAFTFGMLWWRRSLDDFASVSPTARDVAAGVWWLIAATWSYPLVLAVTLNSTRVSRYFAARGQDPWHPLRSSVRAVETHRAARFIGGAFVLLAAGHALCFFWCLPQTPDTAAQAMLHLCGLLVSAAVATPVLILGFRGRRAAVAVAAVAAFCCASWPATAQPTGGLLSPWAADDLLAQAQEQDAHVAADAVRRLARSGDAGQDALLRLLDGPVPPIGIDGALVAVGVEWFDTDTRWSRDNRPRALRLALEWVEVIERSDDVRAMAALEAMGPDENLEPLLRPLLTAQAGAVRKRAAQFLLRINLRPAAMIRALERDLILTDQARHGALAEALVNLRPASDATLARLLVDTTKPSRPAVVAALVQADQPYSPELLLAAERLARSEDGAAHAPEMRLMRHRAEGRHILIELSFADIDSSPAAREIVQEIWPATAPIFRRLASNAAGDPRGAAAAARRLLTALAEGADLAALTDEDDEELRALALMVLAHGAYSERLGPATLRMAGTLPQPASPPQWVRAPSPTASAARVPSAPPVWASTAMCGATLLALGAILVIARGGDHRYGSSASERM